MDRQIAFILAGATLALGFGGYLMYSSMGEYDLDKSAKKEQARVERLASADTDEKGPGLFAALLDKATTKLETSRNVYQGEYFPPTPDGWVLKKTYHDEIVDMTVDYKLDLDLMDKSSMRRLSGWGGQNLARSTDLAYRKGDKVIFMRLVFANKPIKKPLSNAHAWLFDGSFREGPEMILGGATFETRQHKDSDLINIAAETGHYTAIGVFSNASLAEVESLLDRMDMYAFASQTGNPDAGSSVVPFLKSSEGGLQAVRTLETVDVDALAGPVRKAEPKRSPKGNMLASLSGDAEEDTVEAEEKPKNPRKNLLSSLLGGGDDDATLLARLKIKGQPKEAQKGSSFQKIGNFTSRCKSGAGAKVCRVEE